MVSNIFKKRFDDYYNLVNNFFTEKISDPQLLKEYRKQSLSKRIETIRLGHIFAFFIFLIFGFFDYFTIANESVFQHLTIVRLVLIFFVIVPFYFFSYHIKFRKYIRVSLFFTYFIFGGFLIYTSHLLDSDHVSFLHNYLGLNLTIIGLFVILTYQVKDTIILALLLVVSYNIVNYFSPTSGIYYFGGELNIKQFIDINVWLLTVTFLGYILWLYSEQISKQNFLIQRDLRLQKDELRKVNNIKNKFFSLVSHDLKNLISSQYSLSNYMSEKYEDMAEAKRLEFVNLIEYSTKKTLNIFEELMLWVHTQTNKINIEPKLMPLKKLVDETLDVLELSLLNKNLKIKHLNLINDTVFCDENSVKTVLRNVIGNAIKFSNKSNQIEIKTQKENNMIELCIVDSGVGVSKEVLESLFRLDAHYSESGTEGESGTGLGLIVCKELLLLNKGNIRIESEFGKGTSVFIYLPID